MPDKRSTADAELEGESLVSDGPTEDLAAHPSAEVPARGRVGSASGPRPVEATDVLAPKLRLLGGKYRLGRMLGEGGMGSVYEAEHTGLGINVAIKLLNEVFASDPSALTRFRREARAAAAIRHENIVTVTDTGTDEDGVPYLVMELLEGESLSALLRRERMLDPREAAALTVQILAGLSAAHKKGVVHRDLKPGNVLVHDLVDGRHVKILDFGISKFFADAAQNVTATGAVVGTPRFMAPEQARGQSDVDNRVDLHAVGVLLYRMVTGKLPFSARTQEAVIDQILSGDPKPPSVWRPDLPQALEDVIMRAMDPERDTRFQTADEMIDALHDAIPDIPPPPSLADSGGTASARKSEPSLPSFGGSGVSDSFSRAQTAPRGGADLLDTPTADSPSPTRAGTPQSMRHTPVQDASGSRGGSLAVLWVALGLGVVGLVVGMLYYRSLRPATAGSGSSGAGSSLASGTSPGTGRTVTPPTTPVGDLVAGAHFSGPPVRFGVTMHLPKAQVRKARASLVRYLARRLQRPVKLKIYENWVNVAERIRARKLELVALSSYAYVRAKRESPSLKLLASHQARSGRTYQGHILTRADSGLTRLSHLRGKVFCYVDARSTSGYLYPRAIFRQHGIHPDRAFRATRFTSDHLGALRALHSGACDGAAVFAGIFDRAERHGLVREQFHVVASTERIPYDAYCAPGHLDKQLAHSLREALLALEPGSKTTRDALGPAARIVGFVPVKDAAYNTVRRIERLLREDDHGGKKPPKPSKGSAAGKGP